MRRTLIVITCICMVWLALLMNAQAADHGLKTNIPEIDGSLQLISATSPDWKSVAVTIRLYERASATSPWKEVIPACAGVTGKNGLAWGIGLHGTHPSAGAEKREGDKFAPAGVFRLHAIFGYAPSDAAGITRFPYEPVTATSAGVDDPRSHYYNRVVDSSQVKKDWSRAEVMLRPDGLYRWGVIVEHNWKPEPGCGSCIFLHAWRGPGSGTIGCTAMAPENLETIIRRLDASKHPLLVQLPASEYAQRKTAWHLP